MTHPSFTANRAQLLNALTIASRAAAKKTPMPILTHLLVEADAETDDVTVTGSNLEMWIRHSFKANVEQSGIATLTAKLFLESVSKLSGATVEFGPGKTPGSTELKSDRAKINIAGLDPQDWNDMPTLTDPWTFSLPAQEVKTGIAQTIVAVGQDSNQLSLTGINIFVSDGVLSLASTDAHRMHIREIGPVAIANVSVIVPQDPIRAILGSISKEETIDCELSPTQARFTFRDGGLETVIMTRLIDGQFPKLPAYRNKKDATITGSILVSREDLSGALSRAGIFRANDTSAFLFKIGGDTATFEIEKKVEGGNSEDMDIVVDGDCPASAMWSIDFISQMINVIGVEGIKLSYGAHLKAPTAIITAPDDPKFWGCAMGIEIVRLDDGPGDGSEH